jgi:hypothetical protein
MSPILEIYRMRPFPKPEFSLKVPVPAREYKTDHGIINVNYSGTPKRDQIIASVSGIDGVPKTNVTVSPKNGKGKAKIGAQQQELRVQLNQNELEYLKQI